MTEPTGDKWDALREPFPAEHIQTRPGGGGHLSYVSHGHVTDRILAVDPEYQFGPLLNDQGLPVVVLEGLAPGDKVGVWGLLTVLGTDVVEFCSGKDLMDAYSRCLCRCAMRRGVALDLWTGDVPKGEVRKEGGLGEMAVPKTWAKVQAWYDDHGGPGAWDLAQLFCKAASYHAWGETDTKKLTPDQRKVLLQRAAGATVYLAEDESQPLGPSPSVALYQTAWAHVLDGAVLEVPEWQPRSIDPEADAIAGEVFQG